jgi:hypothetical protein
LKEGRGKQGIGRYETGDNKGKSEVQEIKSLRTLVDGEGCLEVFDVKKSLEMT